MYHPHYSVSGMKTKVHCVFYRSGGTVCTVWCFQACPKLIDYYISKFPRTKGIKTYICCRWISINTNPYFWWYYVDNFLSFCDQCGLVTPYILYWYWFRKCFAHVRDLPWRRLINYSFYIRSTTWPMCPSDIAGNGTGQTHTYTHAYSQQHHYIMYDAVYQITASCELPASAK